MARRHESCLEAAWLLAYSHDLGLMLPNAFREYANLHARMFLQQDLFAYRLEQVAAQLAAEDLPPLMTHFEFLEPSETVTLASSLLHKREADLQRRNNNATKAAHHGSRS